MTSRRLRYGGLLLLLVLLVLGAFAFPDVLSAYVVRPVTLSLWALWRIVASVHQGVYWILLIVLCSLLMLRVFSVHEPGVAPAAQQHTARKQTRVEHWRGLFKQARHGREADEALRSSLRNLLGASLRQADRPVHLGLNEAIAAQHISLPPDVREFLALDEPDNAQRARHGSIAARIRRWLQRPGARDDIVIEEVLRWMEAAMEISHDQ